MNRKSKAVTFLLSFIPGLSHIYLGFAHRAIIFFLLFFGAIAGALGMIFLTNHEIFIIGLGIALPIIWLVALVDAISLVDKLEYKRAEGDGEQTTAEDMQESNQKLIAMILSVIPGAGHMYLGLQQEGLFFMSVFFFTIFLMSWLNSSFFLFLLPIIWFYCLFDTLHSTEGREVKSHVESFIMSWIKASPNVIGWVLIILGCLVFLERIASFFLTSQIKYYIKTGIVALLLIVSGIKLIRGPKDVEHVLENSEVDEEEEGSLS